MTARIYGKVVLGVLLVLLVAMVGVDFFATRVAERSYNSNLRQKLSEMGRLIAVPLSAGIDDQTVARARRMAQEASARLTVISADGRVVIDTTAQPAQMENHRDRAEFVDALRGKGGSSVRKSATTGVNYLYVAVPIEQGALRLAVPLAEVESQVDSIRWRMLGITALAFLPAVLVLALIARRTSQQLGDIISFAGELAKGNFRARLAVKGKGELAVLARQLNEAGAHLQNSVEQLEREHSELEKLERVRKDFVINVSHELRTPLASIQGYAETLMDGALEDQANNMRFLGIIRQNAERLASLTSDLLTLSRIELKRQDFHFEMYNLDRIVAGMVDTIGPVAARKDIALITEIEPEAREVYCDSEAVHQVLINLTDNAIKYTPAGGAITIGARSQPKDGLVEVFVRDTGIGIPPEDLPRLFERFYRVDKARSRELGGTGLGLAIVKHLVRAHGGDVQVDSREGQGSTFTFTLSSTIHDAVNVS